MANKQEMANKIEAGIHLFDAKDLSNGVAIQVMPSPKQVSVSVSQHLGRPAIPVVEKGDEVKIGQLIAKADGLISANIFSPICGIVADIKEMETANGFANHIIINNNDNDEAILLKPLNNPSKEEIINRLAECGIVGMGGAGFATSVKVQPKEKVDTFIINAAECEPFITCDHRIMLDYTEQFVGGCELLAKAAGVEKIVIAVEVNKANAIERLRNYLNSNNRDKNIEVKELHTKYPQGAEKQLVFAVTGKKIQIGKLPSSVGCLVNNVHTALSSYLAVTKGQPLTRRIMTVSGGGIKNPSNIWVDTGTSFKDIIEFCGGLTQSATVKLLSGGPMMGMAVSNDLITTTKTTNCLLLMTESEAFTGESNPCINCGKCAKACPMHLMPMYIDRYILADDVDNAIKYGSRNCIECGCCAYTCPAKRPLVQSIRLAKRRDAKRNIKP